MFLVTYFFALWTSLYMPCHHQTLISLMIYLRIFLIRVLSFCPSLICNLFHIFTVLIQGRHVLLESTLPPFPVFCTIDKFIVVQRRRAPFDLPFNRTWNDYKNGFGDVSGEFWLGLEKLHRITNQPYVKYSIRFEMKLKAGKSYYSESNDFYIAGEKELYKIVGIGSRTATSVSASYYIAIGQQFATRDKDVNLKCGANYNGFWYHPSKCTTYAYVRFNNKLPVWTSISSGVEYTEIKIIYIFCCALYNNLCYTSTGRIFISVYSTPLLMLVHTGSLLLNKYIYIYIYIYIYCATY